MRRQQEREQRRREQEEKRRVEEMERRRKEEEERRRAEEEKRRADREQVRLGSQTDGQIFAMTMCSDTEKVLDGVCLTGVHPSAAGGGAEAPGDPAAAAAS